MWHKFPHRAQKHIQNFYLKKILFGMTWWFSQWLTQLSTKPDSPSSILRSHMVRNCSNSQEFSPHIRTGTMIHACPTHIHTQINGHSKCNFNLSFYSIAPTRYIDLFVTCLYSLLVLGLWQDGGQRASLLEEEFVWVHIQRIQSMLPRKPWGRSLRN